MSKGSWPKWLNLYYYKESEGSINGFTGSVTNGHMLFEVFERYGIKHENIIQLKVNDKIQNEEDINQLYEWLNKYRKEWENNEKRKETKQPTKTNHTSSQSKS